MQMIDFDAEQRRADRYSDISRTGFVVTVFALSLVVAFVGFMVYLERAGG